MKNSATPPATTASAASARSWRSRSSAAARSWPYGGEEFAILLPGVEADIAIRVAETLRDGIERLNVPYAASSNRRVTTSCGVASIIPHGHLTAENLVASADRALYAAKHSGRNCVRLADDRTKGTWLRDVSA